MNHSVITTDQITIYIYTTEYITVIDNDDL